MKAAFHIPFFYSPGRLNFLNEVIEGVNKIAGDNEIYIYSNKDIRQYVKDKSGNITVFRFMYDLEILKPFYKRFGRYPYNHWFRRAGLVPLIHPYYLTWECRNKIEKGADKFDVQVYLEDDMLFTDIHFNYWLSNKDICLANHYNPGFLRYETDRVSGQKFYTDLTSPLNKTVFVNGRPFLINDNNPYYAFWIMDRQELKAFINSPEWRFEINIDDYDERAISAIGWHGLSMKRYLGTVIPLVRAGENSFQVSEECMVHHLPDNYIGHPGFCKIRHPLVVQGG